MNYGKQFAQERVAAKLTQKQVADKLGMETPQYISNIERGKCRLAVGHYKMIEKMFGRAAAERLIDTAISEDRRAMRSQLSMLKK